MVYSAEQLCPGRDGSICFLYWHLKGRAGEAHSIQVALDQLYLTSEAVQQEWQDSI